MEVIDGGFGQKKEKENYGPALESMLRDAGCFEETMGFFLAYYSPTGELAFAGGGLSGAETLMAVKLCERKLLEMVAAGGVPSGPEGA